MEKEPTTAATASPTLQARQVYAMAVICLMAGLAIGYLLRGSESPVPGAQRAAGAGAISAPGVEVGGAGMPSVPMGAGQQQPAGNAAIASPHAGAMAGGHMPTLEQMQQMAARQVAPLLEKLKSDPNNAAVLMQVGAIYYTAHQFEEASYYYGKAVQIDARNVPNRTKLAISLFQSGDADGAIAQLNRSLGYEPNDANALFDLGMIRLQGKKDGKGAVAAWQQLLKSNPQLSPDRKAQVQKLMADVLTTLADQHGTQGAQSNDRP